MKRQLAMRRRFPIGAEILADGSAAFRVWAPGRSRVDVVLEDGTGRELAAIAMHKDADGYFAAVTSEVPAGALYRYRLDGQEAYPDPASRFQPSGPNGPSQLIDPSEFRWTDEDWPGVRMAGQVIYEMHVGTFTPEGTWKAAAEQLPELARLGISLIELMPVADWVGDFNWGYDGVDYFAPTRLYGAPDDFRSFVDRAHAERIGVALDVVYNHAGASGNFFRKFSPHYCSERHKTEWGAAFNFDEEHAGPVREFFISNIHYWIEEFHVDGYRIDATQAYFDESPQHILGELTAAARAAANPRDVVIIAESEPQDVRMVRGPDKGGFGMDAAWNDDFHHAAMVRLTGHREAYYTDYLGRADEFIAMLKWGYLYQGQRYHWQRKRRGSPTFGLPGQAFINFLQNHDQLANSASGKRIHELAGPGPLRAMTALLLLGPGTPLLFQGQEFSASTPFRYFNDSPPDQTAGVSAGRAKFLTQFPSLALPRMQARLPEPHDPDNFYACKLNFAERRSHREAYDLHKDLIRLRRDDPVIHAQRADRIDGGTFRDDCFVVRYFADSSDRLLLVNFGIDLHLDPAPQPLLAPPEKCRWELLWTSEDPRYGGTGTPDLEGEMNWLIPGGTAVLMQAVPFHGNSYAYSDT